MSEPLKLHSFLSKTTIHRFAMGSNQPTTTWRQSLHHPYSPTNAPPLDPNHPTTHHTFPQPPHHSPHQAPTTNHLWSPINPTHLGHNHPHHPYAPTHPSPTTPGPNQPTTPDPNHPTTPGHQPITPWPQSP